MPDHAEIPDEIMVNSVDIYTAVPGQDADGGYEPGYPSSPSSSGVSCSAQPREVEEAIDDQNRIMRVLHYHVFFNADPGVKPRDKMILSDTLGKARTLIVQATRDEGGAMSYFVVRAIERL